MKIKRDLFLSLSFSSSYEIRDFVTSAFASAEFLEFRCNDGVARKFVLSVQIGDVYKFLWMEL